MKARKTNLLLNCREATAFVEKKRDGKLTLSENLGLSFHLFVCGVCKLFYLQVAQIDKMVQLFSQKIEKDETIWTLEPSRKASISKAFEEELQKDSESN